MMLFLMSIALSSAPAEGVVYGCEHYSSPAETDGVGTFVDLRAISHPGNRWTLEFDEGAEFQATFSWIDEAKGVGRLEWQGPTGIRDGSVHFVPGTAAIGRPTFWLSMVSDGGLNAPGYICNGILEGEL